MNIILLGPPGAGKGTQSVEIKNKYNIIQLSTGDMLRSLVNDTSAIASQVKAIMKEGKLVPDNIIVDIIKARILEDDCKNGFILDGFPRTISQAESLDEMLSDLNKSLTSVIEISVDDEFLIDRITSRFSCKECGAGYNKRFKKPKIDGVCDICGSTSFIQREDDNESALKKRLQSYYSETKPLIPYYKNKNIFHKINGMQEIDTISSEIFSVLSS